MNNINPHISDLFINGQHYGIIDNPNEYGRTVILHKVEGVNLSSITKEEFIDLMKNGLAVACEKYGNLTNDEINEYIENNISDYAAVVLRDLRKKYKKESTVQKYFAEKMEGRREAVEKHYSYDRNISFTCWPGPHHGVPGVTMGLSNKSTEHSIENAFSALSENEWFRKGTGLMFKYGCNKNTHLSFCGGIVEVLMNEEDKAAADAAQKAIDDDIANFYKGCRYCGD